MVMKLNEDGEHLSSSIVNVNDGYNEMFYHDSEFHYHGNDYFITGIHVKNRDASFQKINLFSYPIPNDTLIYDLKTFNMELYLFKNTLNIIYKWYLGISIISLMIWLIYLWSIPKRIIEFFFSPITIKKEQD